VSARREARAHLEAGDLAAAVAAYDRVLADEPTDGEALLNQSLARYQLGQHDAAIESLERARRYHPEEPVVALNLGVMLRGAERLEAAVEALQEAVDLGPDDASAWQALGSAQRAVGDTAGAVETLKRAVALAPEHPSLLNSLGLAQMDAGRLEAARELFSRGVALAPDYLLGWHNLGEVTLRLGDAAGAENAFARVLDGSPEDAGAQLGLAAARRQRGHLEAAQEALDRVPAAERGGSWYDERGALCAARGDAPGAEDAFRMAAERGVPGARAAWVNVLRRRAALGAAEAVARAGLDEADAELWAALANCLKLQGRTDEARAAFERALGDPPFDRIATAPAIASAALLNLNYLNGAEVRPEVCVAAHEAFGRRLAAPVPRARSKRDALRVGYLSADLRAHAVSHFIEPVLMHHGIETVGFVDVVRPDAITERLEAHLTRAHRVGQLDDDALGALIEREDLDVLVELNGHTGARLPMLARRLAPVQLSYLGYPHDTGLPGIDARIGDRRTDPHPSPRCDWVEQSFLCFRADPDAPEVTLRTGEPVVFGSFNNQAKLRPAWLRLWGRTVAGVEGARLILKNPSLDDAATRDWTLSHLEAGGLDPDRVELVGFLPEPKAHLGLYGRVDIALDPFPYHGTTTTCEALWMGVPVVTCAGPVHAARVGCSLLHQVGLDALVAEDEDGFSRAAQDLARDEAGRARLRGSLRETMRRSPLCDGARLAQALETLFRSRLEWL